MLQVETKDALLHAINEEYVEAVELLLEHEETIHKEGELHVRKMLFCGKQHSSVNKMTLKGNESLLNSLLAQQTFLKRVAAQCYLYNRATQSDPLRKIDC